MKLQTAIEVGVFHVYVVELSLPENVIRFYKRSHPKYDPTKACLYVGETKWSIAQRLQEHLKKPKSLYASKWVHNYYVSLRPDLYSHIPPVLNRMDSEDLETRLIEELRAQGHLVLGGHRRK